MKTTTQKSSDFQHDNPDLFLYLAMHDANDVF